MIPIFDLDDTLYPERSFVESGFRAVAGMLEVSYGIYSSESLSYMLGILASEGRGKVFDRLLNLHNLLNASRLRKCINIYRHHKPEIFVSPDASFILDSLSIKPYMVTDGHKIVQRNKVEALGLDSIFEKIFITNRYGASYVKPSIKCFEFIRRRTSSDWTDMFYVGDNPAKDFVNLNKLGVHTIRIKTGEHARTVAQHGYEAKHTINSFYELPNILENIKNDK
jgi:putative hydrolase of the HAD superfamily